MMLDLDAVQYVCNNFCGLSGIPVRIYQKRRLFHFQSLVALSHDPFDLDKAKALTQEGEISYYQSPYSFYYGILHLEDVHIVFGPTKTALLNQQGLRSIAFSLNVPPASIDDYVAQLESLPSLPPLSLLQILCMIDFSLTGHRLSLENVAIHEETQGKLKIEMEKNQAERTLDNMENYANRPYSALDIENRLLDMVMRGDVAAIEAFAQSAPAIEGGTIAHDQIRQIKNTFIVTATLVSRAAIRGGMDVTAALALSDAYIQKVELIDDVGQLTELSYRLLLDYAERVAEIRLGKQPTPLVLKVSNYVQLHLSEPIKVETIAQALYMGRSRLSTNFKKETGLDLSAYILLMKINEAKRLLRYSDKTFAAISLYLGFCSQSHFTRVFKKSTDVTPLEYRQLHKHY